MKFRAFTEIRGRGARRYAWILLYGAGGLTGPQRVIAESPRNGYPSRVECQTDIDLMRGGLNAKVPVEWLTEGDEA